MHYQGDLDSWARTGRIKEKQVMDSGDWYLIESLVQDIRIVIDGKASDQFSNDLNKQLSEKCDGDAAITLLKKIAL